MDYVHSKKERNLVFTLHCQLLQASHAVNIFQTIERSNLSLVDKCYVLILGIYRFSRHKVVSAHQIQLSYLFIEGHFSHQFIDKTRAIGLCFSCQSSKQQDRNEVYFLHLVSFLSNGWLVILLILLNSAVANDATPVQTKGEIILISIAIGVGNHVAWPIFCLHFNGLHVA